MKSLAEYLEENWNRNVIDHVLRMYVDADGQTCFYIHPASVDGETLDFMVEENELSRIENQTIDAELVTEAG